MKIYLLLLILIVANLSFAQQVIVNADGTHSVVHATGGSTGVVVNPNGTHSTIHSTGSNAGIIVNPNGTHSTFHSAGPNLKVIVNANGTHSTMHSIENNTNTLLNPNSTQSRFQTPDFDTTFNSFHRQPVYRSAEDQLPKWRKRKREKGEPVLRKKQE